MGGGLKTNRAGLGGDVLTTGQAARYCRVAPRTVTKWIDSGVLPGYRIPQSNDRRVLRADLVKFLEKHGMPLNGLSKSGKMLLIGVKAQMGEVLLEKYECLHTRCLLEAGLMLVDFQPEVVVLDATEFGVDLANRAAQSLKGKARLCCFCSEDRVADMVGWDVVVPMTDDGEQGVKKLLDALEELEA